MKLNKKKKRIKPSYEKSKWDKSRNRNKLKTGNDFTRNEGREKGEWTIMRAVLTGSILSTRLDVHRTNTLGLLLVK